MQHIHRLMTGRGWFFIMDPPAFADDAAALACYRTIRPVLLAWCKDHLNGAVPWAESLHTGKPVSTVTTEHHGFTLQSCREFLAVYYGMEDVERHRYSSSRPRRNTPGETQRGPAK